MPDIIPFKGYHYNVKNQEKLEKLVAPPHDVISPAERSAYLKRSSDNIVQIILPDDYSEASDFLNELVKKGRLVQHKEPVFYIYRTKNYLNGAEFERYGLVGLVKLSGFSEKQIIPHERTFRRVKEGRFNLFKETKANFNPIFFIFNGNSTFNEITQKYKSKPPFLVAKDRDKVEHAIWIIDDAQDIQNLQNSFKAIPLLIADGHHRYTSALELAQESGNKYIMGLFVDMNDPNLLIFPTYRLVRYISKQSVDEILDQMKKYFRLKEYHFAESELMEQLGLVIEELTKKSEYTFGIFFYNINSFFLIKLKDEFPPESVISGDYSDEWKRLDVSILHEFIFKQLLDIEEEIDDSENIVYIKDLEEAVQSVKEGLYQALFILNPTKVEQILRITRDNEIMPQKSTYFYPKPLSGLIMYKWDEKE